MRRIASVIALLAALIAPAFAQKAEIDAVNAKWIDFFNKAISAASRRSTAKTRPPSRRVPPW